MLGHGDQDAPPAPVAIYSSVLQLLQVTMLGYGSAIKMLLLPLDLLPTALSRDEVVALVRSHANTVFMQTQFACKHSLHANTVCMQPTCCRWTCCPPRSRGTRSSRW